MGPTALWEHPWPLLQWGIVLGVSLAAAVTDVRERRIPNALTFPVLLSGLLASVSVAGWAGLGDALAGSLLLALPYVVLMIVGHGGGGDVKLTAAVGIWLGVQNAAWTLVAVSVAGAVLGVGYAWRQGRLRGVVQNLWLLLAGVLLTHLGGQGRQQARDTMPDQAAMLPMPYGVAIFGGVCLAAGGMYLWHAS